MPRPSTANIFWIPVLTCLVVTIQDTSAQISTNYAQYARINPLQFAQQLSKMPIEVIEGLLGFFVEALLLLASMKLNKLFCLSSNSAYISR